MHSDDTVFRHLIFVYGTLMRGENNYIYWLANPDEAIFISTAKTSRRYPLFTNLLPDFPDCSPCMLNLPDATASCKPVEGELFLVTDKMLAWLNVLEEVDSGVYKSAPIHVIPQVPITHMPTERQRLLKPFDVQSSLDASQPIAALLRATAYFRSTDFPADWDSAQPKSSTMLLSRFSAGLTLENYGSRFAGGPAHLFSEESARKLQQALNALPNDVQPPSTVAGAGAYGAPLFPAPIVLFIIDGLADNTYPELGNRTPLEVVAGVPPRIASSEPPPPPPPGEPGCEMPAILGLQDGSLCERDNEFVCPGINCLTRAGASGLMDPYTAGVSCGSDTAHLSMFGYPPHAYYRGRGAYEALGAGLPLDDEDLAFKCNFATFADPDEDGFGDEDAALERAGASRSRNGARYVIRRCCDRDFGREAAVLCAALDGTPVESDLAGRPFAYPHAIRVRHAKGHRCVVALTGPRRAAAAAGVPGRLSDKITGTDCLMDGLLLRPCEPTVGRDHAEYAAAAYTCRVVEAASARLIARLRGHPINAARRAQNRGVAAGTAPGPRRSLANVLLLRGAAKKGWAPAFAVRHGRRGVLVAATCVIRGVGAACGLPAPPREALPDLDAKLDAVLAGLRLRLRLRPSSPPSALGGAAAYDFAVLHVKAVDDAGHAREAARKLAALRRCGAAMAALWEALPPGAAMAVAADHATPLGAGDHSSEGVPVAVAAKTREGGAFRDGLEYYSEIAAAEGGGLGRFRGEALVPLLKRASAYYHYRT